MLVRTDDTNAFKSENDPEFLQVYFTIPEGQTCNKAVIVIGDNIRLEFNEPISPIGTELTSEQTTILKDNNCIDLELYDGANRKITIPCIAEFKTRAGVE
jgi:hypothetical protein